MSVQQAYNSWASQYDTNKNKTRDLEGIALRATLRNIPYETCLEIGCGTGKNTEWLIRQATHITAVDLSEEMLKRAEKKISSNKVKFVKADITEEWAFADQPYDLISFSLVLEHIENLDHILRKAASALQPNGYIYIGELHPFKQYAGTKATFDTEEGKQVVECYTHNISDFMQAAKQQGLEIADINEYFDNGDKTSIPRILTLLLRKA